MLASYAETLVQVKHRVSTFTDAQGEMVQLLMREDWTQARQHSSDEAAFANTTVEHERVRKLGATTDKERL